MGNLQDSAWTEGWKKRIQDRVRQQGFRTLSEFMDKYPCETYHELSDRLSYLLPNGGKDIAPIQIKAVQIDESVYRGTFRLAAMDALVRLLHEHLKRGWSHGIHAKFNTSGVKLEWMDFVTSGRNGLNIEIMASTIWSKLEKSHPPKGWKPQNTDDRFIIEAFTNTWYDE